VDGPDTAGREHDEEEIWRDLVSRLEPGLQAEPGDAGEDLPWPAEENLDARSFGARVIKPAEPDTLPSETVPPVPGEPFTDAGDEPFMAAPDDSYEHYIPPPPPPLPHLDGITKGAWLALFGGPAYLLAATMAGWSIPAVAVFCAVAAFVGGFVTLVVRMGDERRDDSGPDDGAVV
jgi:hypothetical protein